MRGRDRLHGSDKGVDHLGAKNAIGAQFPLNELKGIHPLGFFCMNKFTWGHPEPVTDTQERFHVGHFLSLETQ
jgi:hypothetical protein